MLLSTEPYMFITDEMVESFHKTIYTSVWYALKLMMPYIIIIILIKVVFSVLMAKIERRKKIEHNLHISINKEDIKKALKEIQEDDYENDKYSRRKPRR